ncbi:MAG: molybdate ABC transporter permease subunit [Deferribacteraceae bacterium]|jgi:molybdate transport system permease protein|nr:molybdate ABC transporter permease subunit [Deferribacteraceae bacterium]
MNLFELTAAEWQAIRLSLLVGVTAVVCTLPFGLFFGWLLARKEFFGKNLLNTLLHLPMVVPPVVTGYLLLLLFGNSGFFGKILSNLGIPIAFTWRGAALASAVVSFPLMVRSIRIAMELVDVGLESAARTLGASRLKVFFTITVPLAFPGIVAGVVMAFARSLGEFGSTITFVSNIPGETRTLPLALYSQLQVPGGEMAAARLAVVSLIIAFGAMFASEYLARKRKI